MNLLEPDVHDGVLPPIFVVEVPPFLGIDFESLSLHGRSQGGPMLALCFRSALIISVGALRHLVIEARHGYLMSGLQVVERQIDSATTVVTGTILGIGDKNLLILGCSVPEHLGDIPRSVSIMDEQSVALCFQCAMRADQR